MTPRMQRRGADLFTAFVILSVAVALAHLSWRLTGDPGEPPATVAVTSVAAPAPPVDLAQVTALAPFGTPVVSGAGPATGSMQLRAILLAEPRSASSVLIASGGGPARAFVIGQTVDGGGTIEDILIDRVVLRVGDHAETLAFPRMNDVAPSLPSPVGAGPPASSSGVAAIRALIPAAVSGVATTPAPPDGAAGALQAARQGLTDNPRGFLDELGATPADGGYRIGVGASPAVLQAGLMPGDVIEKINGSPVGNVDRDRALFEGAVASGGARVELVRAGRRITLSFPLR